MTVEIKPACIRDACFVAANMREQDRREIAALIDIEPVHLAVLSLQASGGRAYVAYLNGQPVAAMGLTPDVPGVLRGWAWGTDRIYRAVPAITRFCRESWGSLQDEGIRRVEVRTIIDHDISHKWLRKIGARFEGQAHQYGRDGETFMTYALTRDE